jgi:hypothetical protein
MSTDTGEKKAGGPWAQWLNGFSGLGQGAGGDLYRTILKDWEGWFGTQFEKMARSEAFLEQVGKALEGTMLARSQANRWLEQSIKAMRLPSTGDMEEVHKRLDAIERRLDAITERLERAERPKAPAAPKRPAPKGEPVDAE